jgi:hypothetical protein
MVRGWWAVISRRRSGWRLITMASFLCGFMPEHLARLNILEVWWKSSATITSEFGNGGVTWPCFDFITQQSDAVYRASRLVAGWHPCGVSLDDAN